MRAYYFAIPIIALLGFPAWGQTPQANINAAVGYLDTLFNQHDPAKAFAVYCTPDFHHHPQPAYTPAAAAELMQHNIAAMTAMVRRYPATHYDIKQVIVSGDMVMVRALFTGGPATGQIIHDEKHGGIVGPEIGQDVVNIFRIENGKVAENWEVTQPLVKLDGVF